MLSFQLFGFPIRIEWMFWLLCLFLGMDFLQEDGPKGIGRFLIMTAVVLGSIIWHELGHAWARKRSGAPFSEITLHGMGGLCSGPGPVGPGPVGPGPVGPGPVGPGPAGSGRFTRGQSIFIAAAGPAASILLGCCVWLLVLTPGIREEWTAFFVGKMLWVNIGWAILNLLPILPLDGGHILNGLLAGKNAHLVPKIGFVLSLVMAIAGFVLTGRPFMPIIFGLFAYTNWQMIQGQRSTFV